MLKQVVHSAAKGMAVAVAARLTSFVPDPFGLPCLHIPSEKECAEIRECRHAFCHADIGEGELETALDIVMVLYWEASTKLMRTTLEYAFSAKCRMLSVLPT